MGLSPALGLELGVWNAHFPWCLLAVVVLQLMGCNTHQLCSHENTLPKLSTGKWETPTL